jgi:peptide/nickel transport system permease protein
MGNEDTETTVLSATVPMQRHSRSQSLSARVFKDTFIRRGAQIGAGWLVLLSLVAIFAPLLANSRPLLRSVAGQIESPALRYMTAVDITLLLTFFIGIGLLIVGVSYQRIVAGVCATVVLLYLVLSQLVSPPKLSIYEEYRQPSETSQSVDWEVYAPVPYSPKDYLRDYGDTGLQAPGVFGERMHLLGTEENGADLLSRMIHAARLALGIGLVATGIAMVLGIFIGGFMGYFSGVVDMLGMRLVEIFEAVPTLFLLLTFVAFFDRSLYLMMVIIGLTSWPGYARYVRAEFLRLRNQDFVQAAVAAGLPLRSILFRHILPNAVAPVLVAASFGVASAILAEATLSFLGLGLIDDPSWGQMLNQAVRSSTFNWWMALFPGGAIFLTVFSYNLIGEALRDALDPLTQRAESV